MTGVVCDAETEQKNPLYVLCAGPDRHRITIVQSWSISPTAARVCAETPTVLNIKPLPLNVTSLYKVSKGHFQDFKNKLRSTSRRDNVRQTLMGKQQILWRCFSYNDEKGQPQTADQAFFQSQNVWPTISYLLFLFPLYFFMFDDRRSSNALDW